MDEDLTSMFPVFSELVESVEAMSMSRYQTSLMALTTPTNSTYKRENEAPNSSQSTIELQRSDDPSLATFNFNNIGDGNDGNRGSNTNNNAPKDPDDPSSSDSSSSDDSRRKSKRKKKKVNRTMSERNDCKYRKVVKVLIKDAKNFNVRSFNIHPEPTVRRQRLRTFVVDINNVLNCHRYTEDVL